MSKQLDKATEFFIEVKYDGERMQLHKNGSKFRFFSRNGHDFTDDFGHSSSSVNRDLKFAHHVDRAISPSVKTLILDGEICAYNHLTGDVCQKGEQMNIRHLKPDDPTFQQCLYVYDILLVNDKAGFFFFKSKFQIYHSKKKIIFIEGCILQILLRF